MSIKDAGKAFVGVISGIKFAAVVARKGKAMIDAVDDDTDGDGFPQYEQLKTQFKGLITDGKAFGLRVKDFAVLAFAYFQHILEAANEPD